MYTIKRLLGFAAMFLISLNLSGQDIHFSQFYMSPQTLNPAMTGVMNCNSRFVANLRNQWASVLGSEAYNTFSFGYDQKKPVGRDDYFGIGASVFADVAGATRFGMMQGKLHIAYSKKMGGERGTSHYLSIGADVGVGQWAIRKGASELRWSSQHSNGQYDPDVAPGVIGMPNFLYGDIGIGLLWFSNFKEGSSFYAGVAAAHLNRPNVSFSNTDAVPLNSKYTFHAGGTLAMSNSVSLVPNIVALVQGPHNQLNLGSSLRFDVGGSGADAQGWQAGLWYRLSSSSVSSIHSDALIFTTRFDTGTYGLGFSYDYNISKLQEGGTLNGAFELSLIYLICGNEKRGVYCPRF